MTDSMKFGPEWLRNMSTDAGSSSSSNANSSTGAVSFGFSFNSTTAGNNTVHNNSLNQTAGTPRYQLAEFRYGREEMLLLFDKNIKLPELLPKFKKLFIEKVQCPLALLPPSTDDEMVSFQFLINIGPHGFNAQFNT